LAFRDQLLALGINPKGQTTREFPLRNDTVDALSRGMWGAVNEGGTGAGAHDPNLDIAGKTGTAQVVSAELQKSARKTEYRDNAWFVGYAPSTKPEIVVSALVMQGAHSTVAVPIARDVIKAYFEKKASRKVPPDQLQTQVRVMSQVSGTLPGEPSRVPSRQ
jgi:penicillin-binding protein 2